MNHIRTSHNPYSKEFMNLCDEYGILVVDELYDKWLDQYCGGRAPWALLWQKDIPEWIKRDRNHPSVIFWSLGNELQTYWHIPHADWGVTPYRMQRELLKRYDKTRLVTVAMHPRGRLTRCRLRWYTRRILLLIITATCISQVIPNVSRI